MWHRRGSRDGVRTGSVASVRLLLPVRAVVRRQMAGRSAGRIRRTADRHDVTAWRLYAARCHTVPVCGSSHVAHPYQVNHVHYVMRSPRLPMSNQSAQRPPRWVVYPLAGWVRWFRWSIRVTRLIRGIPVHRINHIARSTTINGWGLRLEGPDEGPRQWRLWRRWLHRPTVARQARSSRRHRRCRRRRPRRQRRPRRAAGRRGPAPRPGPGA